jgi:hypothetical protein
MKTALTIVLALGFVTSTAQATTISALPTNDQSAPAEQQPPAQPPAEQQPGQKPAPAPQPPKDPALDSAKANRFFRDLDGLTTGLELRIEQMENDGTASGEAQAIEAITQPCEHSVEEKQAVRVDTLTGDSCPVTYDRTMSLLSTTDTVNKVKLETKTVVKDEPALSLNTLREDVATSYITVAQAQQVVAYNVIEKRTVTSSELPTVTMDRTLSAAQNAAGAQKVTIAVEATGGLELNALVVITQDKDGNGSADCKLGGEVADCNVVAYLLGMIGDDEQSQESKPNNRQVPVIQPDDALKMFIQKK